MAKKSAVSKTEANFRYVPKSKDLPPTQGMLHLVRKELKAEMRAGFSRIDARFSELDARFSKIDERFSGNDARFSNIDARFSNVDAQFSHLSSKLDMVLSEVARIGVIVEEQNSKNRIALEGVTGLYQRQDRIEKRMDDVESMVRSIAKIRY